MQHIHKAEIQQIHLILQDKYPIVLLCSKVAIHVLKDYSSNEMKIEDNQRHDTVNVYVVTLIRTKKYNLFYYKVE